MKTRFLGTAGYAIGEVGLGCWQFGGDFGHMTEVTTLAIMGEAVAKGVTLFRFSAISFFTVYTIREHSQKR